MDIRICVYIVAVLQVSISKYLISTSEVSRGYLNKIAEKRYCSDSGVLFCVCAYFKCFLLILIYL